MVHLRCKTFRRYVHAFKWEEWDEEVSKPNTYACNLGVGSGEWEASEVYYFGRQSCMNQSTTKNIISIGNDSLESASEVQTVLK